MTASSPVRSPFTAPRTTIRRALTFDATRPPCSTVTSPSTCTSPSMRPWISTFPSPAIFPRTCAPRAMTVVTPAISHVHVDVALELGSVCDGDARRLHVADDPGARLQVHPVARRDVPRDRAGDRERTADDVGLDHRARLDGDRLARGELPANGPLDDDVLVRRDLSLDRDSRADDGGCHVDLQFFQRS